MAARQQTVQVTLDAVDNPNASLFACMLRTELQNLSNLALDDLRYRV